jgi:hypothetical protein
MSLFFALPMAAATIDDVKAAVRRLSARQPVQATYSTERTSKAEGRFANDKSKRTASVKVSHDAEGISVTFPPAMLEGARNGGQDIIGSIRSIEVVQALDFRDALLTLLEHATVIAETRTSFSGRPARLLQLELKEPPKKESNTIRIGSVKKDDKMKLWIGDDHLPIAADRTEKSSAGVLMIRASGSSRTVYTFGHTEDRLVLARVETSVSGSAMGQSVESSGVQTLTIH